MKHKDEILEKEKLEVTHVDIENELFTFTARSLSKDFVCEDGLQRLANDSVGKSLIWRHAHPIEEKEKQSHIYGTVLESTVDDGHIVSKYQVYDHTQDHLDLQDIIVKRFKNEDPLGISMQYRTYFNHEGEAIHYDVFEHSGTPIPQCITCKTINTKNEKPMTDENEEENEEMKKVKELEKRLTEKTSKLEKYQTTIKKLEDKLQGKDKKLEQEKEVKKTLESRVSKLEQTIDFLNEKKPIIQKILEIDDNPIMRKKYPSWSVEELEEHLEYMKEKAEYSTPQTKSIKQSAREAKTDIEDEKHEVEQADFERFLD